MNIYEIFEELEIKYDEVEHNAVYTSQEAEKEKISSRIDGLECKNLFLKDTKKNYYLVLIKSDKIANLKELSKLLNTSRLSFANEEELLNILNLEKGSVTPLGIINDNDGKVLLVIDKDLKDNKILFHPNVNTKTVSIKYDDLIKLIDNQNHKFIVF